MQAAMTMAGPEHGLGQVLADFQAPYLQEKLLADGTFPDAEAFQEAFIEWKKYMALNQWEGALAMTSREVDAVWHQFILFTREYHAFCHQFFGEYVHHAPATPSRPVAEGSRTRFREAYKRHFGDIPAIWGTDTNCKSDCGCEKGKCSG